MSDNESLIDFEPMQIDSLSLQDGKAVVVFPQQPCFSQAVDVDGERRVPVYKCTLHIHSGRVEVNKAKMPFQADEWQLTFHQGSRRCFLPSDLDVAGPIELRIGSDIAPDIIILGERAVLHLDEVVRFETYKKK